MTVAKLIAARDLGVAVVMVDRPTVQGTDGVPTAPDVAGALAWLAALPGRV
jgi:precorrin-6x reductase